MKRLLGLVFLIPLLAQGAASVISQPGTGGTSSGSATNVAAADITDATTVGIDLMTAADEDAAWLTLGGDTRVSNVVHTITNYVTLYVTNLTAETFLVGTNDIIDELDLKAPSASPTLTGTVTLPATLLSASAVADPASATNIILNFAHAALTYTVTNNVHLIQSTNRPGSASLAAFTLLRLAGDTVDRTLSWHSSWKRLGTNITTIPSNKIVVLSAMVIGDAETGVTFGIAKEE